MKNVTSYSTGSIGETIKNWGFGMVCGAILAVGVAFGTGHVNFHPRATITQPVVAQQSALSTAHDLVPPPVDEYVHYQRLLTAQRAEMSASAELVPPLHEIQVYKLAALWQLNNAASQSQPIFGLTPH